MNEQTKQVKHKLPAACYDGARDDRTYREPSGGVDSQSLEP